MADSRYTLEQATVVLFNPLSQMRATLRDAMLTLGFRNILDFGDLERARGAMVERCPDLVLLDLDREKQAVCGLVREVRQARLCADPFTVILALSWNPSVEAVNNGMEAGIDDIVTMPISLKLLSDRLDALIRHRKRFVVTTSYVGPDRRAANRAAPDPLGLAPIPVPNNLRFRATGDQEAAASGERIRAIRAVIDHHRLNRYAQRVGWLADQAVAAQAAGTELPAARMERNAELARMVENLASELQLHGYGGLLEITDSMAEAMEAVAAAPSRQLYELLKLHAFAVTATLLEKEGAAELVIEALNEATDKLRRVRTA